jgi:putative SOS response-associated peptidase YedK
MCGRYVMSRATGDLLSYFDAKEVEGVPPRPSWNVAPTLDVPIVAERLDEGSIERHLLVAHWGLVPSWAKDAKIGSRMINARSESILEKPSFRKAAVKRRAVIPAEGYYEWQKTEDGKKIPNYLYSEKEPLLGFAGLYEWWADRPCRTMTRSAGCSTARCSPQPPRTRWATCTTGRRSSFRGTGSPNGWTRT